MGKTLTATLLVAAGLLSAPGITPVAFASPALPGCQHEDGNTDGTACTWTDPDTGAQFVVDSANYQRITEDDPRWDCRTMGDLECGPANSQGVAAGRYADGLLVQAWDEYR